MIYEHIIYSSIYLHILVYIVYTHFFPSAIRLGVKKPPLLSQDMRMQREELTELKKQNQSSKSTQEQ